MWVVLEGWVWVCLVVKENPRILLYLVSERWNLQFSAKKKLSSVELWLIGWGSKKKTYRTRVAWLLGSIIRSEILRFNEQGGSRSRTVKWFPVFHLRSIVCGAFWLQQRISTNERSDCNGLRRNTTTATWICQKTCEGVQPEIQWQSVVSYILSWSWSVTTNYDL